MVSCCVSNIPKLLQHMHGNIPFKSIPLFISFYFFVKWANPGLFLFIFVLFKHNIKEKTLGFSRIRTRIVGVEGEHADHLTTTTANLLLLKSSTPHLDKRPLECTLICSSIRPGSWWHYFALTLLTSSIWKRAYVSISMNAWKRGISISTTSTNVFSGWALAAKKRSDIWIFSIFEFWLGPLRPLYLVKVFIFMWSDNPDQNGLLWPPALSKLNWF